MWNVNTHLKTTKPIKFAWLEYITGLLSLGPGFNDMWPWNHTQNTYILLRHYRNTLSAGLPNQPATTTNPLYCNTIALDFRPTAAPRSLDGNGRSIDDRSPQIETNCFDPGRPEFDLFRLFIKVNMSVGSRIFTPHPSFYFFFIRNIWGATAIASIPKLFTRWNDAYHLFFNLHYYRVDLLTFGTPFFQDEVLAINWNTGSKWRFTWKFTRHIFYLQSTRITNYGDYIFSQLQLTGLNTALVLDTPYHLNTLYYLHSAGFYSIGPVPTNYNSTLVDFAVPTGVNSIFTHLFFLRFVLRIRRMVSRESFYSLTSSWESVRNSGPRYNYGTLQ